MENPKRRSARRQLLKQAVLLVGSVALLFQTAHVAQAQGNEQHDAALHVQKLSDAALFVQGPDSNVLVVDSSEGLILIDGGNASWQDALHAAIAENFPGRPYRALFNTHWHPEQTGSNERLGKQGVEIIAHENTMLWESTEVWQRWSDRTFAPLPPEALPKTVFYEDGEKQIGDRTFSYGYLRGAHTDGDIWVYVEGENILVTGGLVSNGRWPEIDWWTGGFVGTFMDAWVTLLTLPDANTKIVPAYGPLMNLIELRAQNQMYLTIFDRLHRSVIDSEGVDELIARKPTAEFEGEMGDATQFMTLAFDSFRGHVRDPQNDRFLNIP